MIVSGQKTLLKISGCTVAENGSISVDSSRPFFEALINPSGYGHDFSIKYAKNQTLGQAGNEAKFHASQPQKLNLKELILDGTGVILGTKKTVKEQVQTLRNTIYSYVGVKHETPIVQIVWGSLIFYGRAEGMKFDYTLFKPNGEPLRAKITLNFVEYISPGEMGKKKAASSPDLTHLITVKAGDTLPLLCDRIYRDSSYYMEVARINGLSSFRNLTPGTTLKFPPLAN
ncbi:peptidoglycan-binding protein [Undibacterium sp. FT147W]|uniref:Peptidoglycan-binding protein n=1 Tax=Undibacterium rivi TaxID=2828729 RepID=A0ABS5H1R6_9BURK|nr:peptidoglycan-binding protein [Undibacterium rivi]